MITNCDFRFVCPENWEEMADLPDGEGKHCAHCQRSVITVHTRGQFDAAARRGDCVAVFPEGEVELPPLTGAPLPSCVPLFKPDPADQAHTPPYDWSEIEENLARPARAPHDPSGSQRPPPQIARDRKIATADAQIDRELFGLTKAGIALVEALPDLTDAPSQTAFESL